MDKYLSNIGRNMMTWYTILIFRHSETKYPLSYMKTRENYENIFKASLVYAFKYVWIHVHVEVSVFGISIWCISIYMDIWLHFLNDNVYIQAFVCVTFFLSRHGSSCVVCVCTYFECLQICESKSAIIGENLNHI